MNAPRAFPTCSGPVGLADTNSTLTDRAGPAGDPAPGRRVGEDRGDRRLEGAVAKPQVEEPGRRDLGRGDRRARRIGRGFGDHLGRERRADGERRHAVRPGELHREVAGEVPVDRVGGSLDLDRGAHRVVRPGRQRAGRDRPIPGALDRRPDIRTECRWSCRLGDGIRVGHGLASVVGWPDGSGAAARLSDMASQGRGVHESDAELTVRVQGNAQGRRVTRSSTFVSISSVIWCS